MERNGKKKVMLTLMMLMLVVVAQGRATIAAADVLPDTEGCIAKCYRSCGHNIFRKHFAGCFALCMIKYCRRQPGELIYNCTSVCAKFAIDSNLNAGYETMRYYFDKCYESCKDKM